ncbi:MULTISPECIES: universal stress protein [unclassified Streptomyces]|uniref:universal stress protein n=1 Tax=unclassified Streptomyces TaxID=2593676 RepID=UPI001BAF9B1B|nr:universal stress protein [Streptomyces sp. A2-16]QUC60001.1 universal stress protein [Streptomyces sp. A2-16]
MSTRDHKNLWDYGVHAPGPPLSGHVLVGVDGSDQAWRALDRAAEEAQARLAPLEILHAWPWAGHGVAEVRPGAHDRRAPIDTARDVLEAAAARARERAPELDVVATLSPEPAAAELVRRGDRAALTVLGSRGAGRAAEVLAGSVSLRVAARCGSPLLVVRGEWVPGEPEHGTVLVGVADDVDAGAALFAFEEARRRGAGVWALHVSAVPELSGGPGTPPAGPLEADLKTLLDSEAAVPRMTVAAAREKHPGVGVRIDTVWTGAAGALVEATRAADLVVITARHRHGRGLGPHTGSFTHALLHRAHCPVALVPVG